MTPDEMRPREGEEFYPWLGRIDASTFAYTQRENHTKEEMEAYRRGYFEGEHALLFRLYALLKDDVRDAELLVQMTAAGMIALKRRRSSLDFRLALEHHAETNDEVREHRALDTTEDEQRGSGE